VTVEELGHPLHGRRFRVAFRSFRPGSRGAYVLVFYRDGILLRIPAAALSPPDAAQFPRTKLHAEAIAELVSLAQAYGLCPSPRDNSGRASTKRRRSRS